MSLKAMIFIDGTWFYRNRTTLFARNKGEQFEIDYARMPRLITEAIANNLDEDISLVRTNYYGTLPSQRTAPNASKQSTFYDFLEHNCGYETEIHSNDSGIDESWIKVSVASSMLFYAAQPGAYDLAILVGDDPDYTPALRRVRLFGKRVQIVGIHNADGKTPPPHTTLGFKTRVRDFPLLWLDDFVPSLQLVREKISRTCKVCGAKEETTWAGPEFFCNKCREQHQGQ